MIANSMKPSLDGTDPKSGLERAPATITAPESIWIEAACMEGLDETQSRVRRPPRISVWRLLFQEPIAASESELAEMLVSKIRRSERLEEVTEPPPIPAPKRELAYIWLLTKMAFPTYEVPFPPPIPAPETAVADTWLCEMLMFTTNESVDPPPMPAPEVEFAVTRQPEMLIL
jgi:hypothetical protein